VGATPSRCDEEVGATRGGVPSIRRLETVGAFAVIVSGVLLHFAYDWSRGSRVVAVIAPANESVWEHLKLVVMPVAVLGVVETKWVVDRRRLWWAKFVEVVVACCFIVAFFYSYTGAFGVDSFVAVDVLSFFFAVAGGQCISYRLIGSSRLLRVPLRASVVGLALVVVGFGVLTFTPPHVPLFQEVSTGVYGPT
jgi:hypothetical protein